MTGKQYVLSEAELNKLFEFSKQKYSRLVAECNPIYQHQKKQLNITKEEEQLIHATAKRIIGKKDRQLENVLDNKMQRIGFQTIDPYYIACVKPLGPVVLKAFYQKGLTSQNVDQQFAIEGINEGLEDLIGNAHYRFKRKFYKRGDSYYKTLSRNGILEKFPGREYNKDNDGPAHKQISMSWITDFLDHMRATSKQQGYNHLIQKG